MNLRNLKNYKTIIQNTGYLSIVELLRLVMPFIALPYIIATVGTGNYGLAVFSQTIISYFIVFINFGLDVSAVKDVSIHRHNKSELNKIVSSVLLIKSGLFVISFLVLLCGLWVIPFLKIHKTLFLFAFLTCFSELLFPVWYYQGIEKMKYLTLIRVLSVLFYTVSVFLFVHLPQHYIRVVLLQSLGNVLAGGISLYLLLSVEKIKFVIPDSVFLKRTFTDSVSFFFSRLSVVLNGALAKTFSGIFFSMNAVAAFDLAQKIANIALVPAQMMNQAVYPHLAKTQDRRFASQFLKINALVACAVALSMYLLAPFAVTFFAKGQLSESITLTRILSLWTFTASLTTYLGSPVLVSFGYPKPFNRSVILSTLVLFLVYGILYFANLFTIYNFAFALFFAELVILIYRGYFGLHYNIFTYDGRFKRKI